MTDVTMWTLEDQDGKRWGGPWDKKNTAHKAASKWRKATSNPSGTVTVVAVDEMTEARAAYIAQDSLEVDDSMAAELAGHGDGFTEEARADYYAKEEAMQINEKKIEDMNWAAGRKLANGEIGQLAYILVVQRHYTLDEVMANDPKDLHGKLDKKERTNVTKALKNAAQAKATAEADAAARKNKAASKPQNDDELPAADASGDDYTEEKPKRKSKPKAEPKSPATYSIVVMSDGETAVEQTILEGVEASNHGGGKGLEKIARQAAKDNPGRLVKTINHKSGTEYHFRSKPRVKAAEKAAK